MRRPNASWSLVLALAVAVAPEAARADALASCKDEYVEARFEEAERCIDRALTGLAERPAQLCDAYAFLAATRLAEEDEAGARRAIAVALAIDPRYDPADPLLRAPRVQDLLSAARPPARAGRPVVVPDEPDPRGDSVLVFSARSSDVRDPLVVRVDVRFRLVGGRTTDPMSAELHASSALRDVRLVAVRRPAEARESLYWFTLETPDGVPVTRVGSADAPLTVALDDARATDGPRVRRSRRSEATAWYERWWVWAGLAGLVATGVVLFVVLGQDDESGAIRIQIQ